MLFNQYCNVLEKHKKQLHNLSFYPENLREISKTLVQDKKSFTYSFSQISLIIPKKILPSHTIPRKVGNIEVILSINDDVIIKKTDPITVEDPLVKLEKFNIILNSGTYTSSWHLDREDKSQGQGEYKFIHPIYHLTFGGHYMESLQKDDTDEFGKALIIRAPRIMHPPMELVLGLDFIFSHFIPQNELDLLTDPGYKDIIFNFKKYIWMPFALAFAKNYCDTIEINRKSMTFDDSFVNSILRC